MPETLDLLVELGTEELPPKDLSRLSEAFEKEILEGLSRSNLDHGEATRYATPRRLAVWVRDVTTSQPERQVERRGPALAVAFDADGNPTKAATGFARSCGVDVEHLETLETDKGSWLVFRTTEVAQFTLSLLAPLVNEALTRIPVARRMRWGRRNDQFVRPVQWAVILFGGTPVEAEVMGVTTGNATRGHRFHHPASIVLEAPADYANALYAGGHVVADFDTRRDMIERQLVETAQAAGGQVLIDPALLDEVTSMVEWPVPVLGRFDEEFLELPAQALIATMQGHQKYFPVLDDNGELMAAFITISNIDSTQPDSVREGNERVIRPRLKDAAFFVGNDTKVPLADRLEALEAVVFQAKLGSMADKSRRVSALARHVAIAMGGEPAEVDDAGRAGLLAKCDLVTEMVGEFPELQGYMGGHYAARSGESAPVAKAIEQSYLPRFAGDRIPDSLPGRAVTIADKLDTLAGIFAAGMAPSGDKDPFALRRAALGVLRVIIEGELDIDLSKLLAAALEELPAEVQEGTSVDVLFDFMIDRLRAYFADQGIGSDVFAAVQARRPTRPYDFARRVNAVEQFRQRPEATSLAAANKRIQNILRQAEIDVPADVNDGLLREDAEWDLAAKMVGISPRVAEMLRNGDYESAMAHLAGLRDSIDSFFDSVKVMADEEAIKRNRLALLNNVGTLFMQTADISELQS